MRNLRLFSNLNQRLRAVIGGESRSGEPIKKVNQPLNRFHAVITVSDAHQKMRVCLGQFKAIKQRSGARRSRQGCE